MTNKNFCQPRSMGDAVYGLGFVGALIYFMQTGPTFGDKLFGVVKAILWPAFLIYQVLATMKL